MQKKNKMAGIFARWSVIGRLMDQISGYPLSKIQKHKIAHQCVNVCMWQVLESALIGH